METIDPHTELTEVAAQQLLGTLSKNCDDIRAAYLHQYRNCALELSRADTLAEQQRLEQQLQQLRQAQNLLLGEPVDNAESPAIVPTEASAPESNVEQPAQSAANDATSSQTAMAIQTADGKPILLSSTLVVLLCSLVLTATLYWSQAQQLEQLQAHLQQQQQTHQQLNNSHIALQQSFDQNLQRQSLERQQWTEVTNQQHQQIQQQLSLIEQQNASSELQQQLAQVDKQLFIERRQTLKLQQQVARLDQQANVFIDELCSDSAATGPAVDNQNLSEYMNRCRLLWSLADK